MDFFVTLGYEIRNRFREVGRALVHPWKGPLVLLCFSCVVLYRRYEMSPEETREEFRQWAKTAAADPIGAGRAMLKDGLEVALDSSLLLYRASRLAAMYVSYNVLQWLWRGANASERAAEGSTPVAAASAATAPAAPAKGRVASQPTNKKKARKVKTG